MLLFPDPYCEANPWPESRIFGVSISPTFHGLRGTSIALSDSVIRSLAVFAVLASTAARADGVYFTQTVGLSHASESTFGRPLQTRAGFGARVRYLAIEAWMSSDTQLSREGAWLFVGGEPKMKSDLDSYGVTARAIAPVHRTAKATVEAYARGNLGLAKATGELDGYRGPLAGLGGGLQIRGSVRALGFAWGPLFWLDRGPRVTAALFLDAGYDLVELHGERTIRTGLVRTTLGFAVGSSF